MKLSGLLLSALSIVIVVLVDNSMCNNNSYDKLCYIRYLVKNNLLEGNFRVFNMNDQLEAHCESAVNLTLEAIRTSSKEPCVAEFLNRKDVRDVLLKKYVMPQLVNGENKISFDSRFTDFRKRAVNISVIACNNKDTFKPDIVAWMKYARNNKESKQKELKCLESYIKKSSDFPHSEECVEIVKTMKNDFNQKIDGDVKKAFAPPHDQLIDYECGMKKVEKEKMFEKFGFFVVLATTRDLNDRQIQNVAKSSLGSVNNAQKTMFECMNV